MVKEEYWEVIRVTARRGMAYVELGRYRATPYVPTYGPAFKTQVDNAPHVGDKVRLAFAWGDDYAAPVIDLRPKSGTGG